jgi:glycine cleavage system H protein
LKFRSNPDRAIPKEQDMAIPADRKYSGARQWALAGSDGAIAVGITHHAQDLPGDLVLVESQAMGHKLKMGEQRGVVESVKPASDVYAIISGEVPAVNGEPDTARRKSTRMLTRPGYSNSNPPINPNWRGCWTPKLIKS